MDSVLFDKFKRVNNRVAPDLIGIDELADLKNCILDSETGKPQKRGNWVRHHSTAQATGTILKVADLQSGSTNRMAVASSTKIETYNPDTSAYADWIISLNSGFKFNVIPFGDKFIFVFDTDDDPVMGHSNFSTYWNLELTPASNSQIEAIQSFHDNGGNLTQNTLYKYIMVGITEDGQLTPPSRPFTHLYGTATRTTDDDTLSTKVYFKNLPYISDSRVISRLIFRTKGELEWTPASSIYGGIVFYLAVTLDNDSAGTSFQDEWDDNLSDDSLGVETITYLNMPTRAKYVCFNNERLFLGNFTQLDQNFISPASTNTGGTPPSGYTDGIETAITDISGSGTLVANTQYDYRIHYEDKYGRLSKYYIDVGFTTANDAAVHSAYIQYIPWLVKEEAEIYPNYAIYRRTGGSGSYYYIATHPSTNISYSDTGDSDGAVWDDPSDDTKDYPSAITFSGVSSPSVIADEDKRQIFFDDGDIITGIFDDIDGVIVYKKNSICKMFTNGSPVNWSVFKVVENIGCSEPETLVQQARTFYGVYNGKVYKYASGSYPEDIGYYYQTFLDTITTWYDSIITEKWYMIACYDGATYWVLVYDLKLEAWYRFSTTACKALCLKKYTQQIGRIFGTNSDRLTYYSDSTLIARADTETGSTVQINPTVKTKDVGDGISKNRLRKLKFSYLKATSQDTTITITDPVAGTTSTITDNTGSSNKVLEEVITGNAIKPRRFNIQITGAGFNRWDALRVDLRKINESSR